MMDAQPLFRGSLSIEEQRNGFYTVRTGCRHEHVDIGTGEVYPNLTWSEVETLVFSTVDDWSTQRAEFHQVVLAPVWDQLNLFEISEPAA